MFKIKKMVTSGVLAMSLFTLAACGNDQSDAAKDSDNSAMSSNDESKAVEVANAENEKLLVEHKEKCLATRKKSEEVMRAGVGELEVVTSESQKLSQPESETKKREDFRSEAKSRYLSGLSSDTISQQKESLSGLGMVLESELNLQGDNVEEIKKEAQAYRAKMRAEIDKNWQEIVVRKVNPENIYLHLYEWADETGQVIHPE